MSPNPQSKSPDKVPLWIIAFSLLTIAICLVALVFRSFTGREPESEIATTESHRQKSPPKERPKDVTRPVRSATAPSETSDVRAPELVIGSATQTVVQTSQTIVITPPLRGLALGAKREDGGDSVVEPRLVGTVIGQVTLQEEPPPEKIFDLPAFLGCEGLSEHPRTTHNYVVGEHRGLANAFIRLVPTPATGPKMLPVTNSVSLTFSNCDLQPYLVAVAANDRLVFRNHTSLEHKLEIRLQEGFAPIATIPVATGTEFSRPAMRVMSPDKSQRLEIFFVRCAFHEWEQARIATLSEPHFAITDLEGRFAISNVPPYAYAVELHHPTAYGVTRQSRNITLHADATQAVTFRIYPKR